MCWLDSAVTQVSLDLTIIGVLGTLQVEEVDKIERYCNFEYVQHYVLVL